MPENPRVQKISRFGEFFEKSIFHKILQIGRFFVLGGFQVWETRIRWTFLMLIAGKSRIGKISRKF